MSSSNSKLPNVLVLLATFNGEKWCHDQTNSILNQVGVNVCIAVSDDSSTDATMEIIASLNDPRIMILPAEKRFGCACKNFFRLMRDVDFTCYDYVALSDQDDLWNADKLAYSVNIIKNKGVDAFSSNVTAFWPDGRKRLIVKSQPQCKWDFLFESAGPGCTFVFTQKLASHLSAFLRENISKTGEVALHDWFAYAFARSKGYKWWIDANSTMMYRQHCSNELGANTGIMAAFSRASKFISYWYMNQVLLISDLTECSNLPVIERLRNYTFMDRLYLALHLSDIRRSVRDRFFLFILLFLPRLQLRKSDKV